MASTVREPGATCVRPADRQWGCRAGGKVRKDLPGTRLHECACTDTGLPWLARHRKNVSGMCPGPSPASCTTKVGSPLAEASAASCRSSCRSRSRQADEHMRVARGPGCSRPSHEQTRGSKSAAPAPVPAQGARSNHSEGAEASESLSLKPPTTSKNAPAKRVQTQALRHGSTLRQPCRNTGGTPRDHRCCSHRCRPGSPRSTRPAGRSWAARRPPSGAAPRPSPWRAAPPQRPPPRARTARLQPGRAPRGRSAHREV